MYAIVWLQMCVCRSGLLVWMQMTLLCCMCTTARNNCDREQKLSLSQSTSVLRHVFCTVACQSHLAQVICHLAQVIWAFLAQPDLAADTCVFHKAMLVGRRTSREFRRWSLLGEWCTCRQSAPDLRVPCCASPRVPRARFGTWFVCVGVLVIRASARGAGAVVLGRQCVCLQMAPWTGQT